MPIPLLDKDGNLPQGTWTCTIAEVEERFGFTRRRRELIRVLRQLLAELRRRRIHAMLLIDGSFVTSLPSPLDMDVIVEVPPDLILERLKELHTLRERFRPELDAFFVGPRSLGERQLLALFGEDRLNRPRGFLRVVEGS